MIVRRVEADDWRRVRALRLTALEEYPLAFAERLVEAQRKPDDRWRTRTARQAVSESDFLAVAESGEGDLVATTGVFLDTARPGCATVYYVYVAPAWRGRGVVEALVSTAEAWTRGRAGITALALLVNSENDRAIAAYSRLGFADIGVETAHPLDPRKKEREMRKALEPVA